MFFFFFWWEDVYAEVLRRVFKLKILWCDVNKVTGDMTYHLIKALAFIRIVPSPRVPNDRADKNGVFLGGGGGEVLC